ncbi:Lrp/AsnC family transcriptional regulator [Novosphingobium beihaiensis]|uniref:Lrp/AsnC family transcriptional regulator n=1 Tax=Novosphingobium beihaiensis TaxID=2930389 RepID=A0ABT0BS09_9SPHN|nr:Lrp/AsnC family transcriptional regulator [Novosphingobium beihaiensis]MCJ2187851.1 Lrp/AsnC family transcriptional regulator [Novosphingobium beihaiensis]
MLDRRDLAILDLLQRDAEMPVYRIAEAVSLSASACSRRIAELKRLGYIRRTVAVLDREKLGLGLTVFVIVRAQHSADWLERFRTVLADTPEVLECHRLTGQADYILKLAVRDIANYDTVYKALIARLAIQDVSAHISMEVIKDALAVPLR